MHYTRPYSTPLFPAMLYFPVLYNQGILYCWSTAQYSAVLYHTPMPYCILLYSVLSTVYSTVLYQAALLWIVRKSLNSESVPSMNHPHSRPPPTCYYQEEEGQTGWGMAQSKDKNSPGLTRCLSQGQTKVLKDTHGKHMVFPCFLNHG